MPKEPVVSFERVTPRMASEWLRRNTDNRPLRRTVVENHKEAWLRGEYVITHQGVAFSESGTLLDGQHRLTALSEMPDTFSITIMVTRGLQEKAFEVIDDGLRRSAADALREDPRIMQVSRLLAHIYLAKPNGITKTFQAPFVEFARPYHDSLTGFCSSVSRTWSSSGVRSAAVVSMANGIDPDYVCLVYRSLVMSDFPTMPNCAQVLYRASLNGTARGYASMELFCKCLRIFDPSNADLKLVRINDQAAMLKKVRDFLRTRIKVGDEKKMPSQSEGEKRLKQLNSISF